MLKTQVTTKHVMLQPLDSPKNGVLKVFFKCHFSKTNTLLLKRNTTKTLKTKTRRKRFERQHKTGNPPKIETIDERNLSNVRI